MATRPLCPTFVANDSDITKLQALSDSVGFVGMEKVTWHLYKTSDQGALTAGANTQITFGTVAFDPDGVSDGSGVTIVTRGIYECELTLPFTNTAAAGKSCIAFFKLVTGSNNPLGSGVTVQFGTLSDLTTGTADEMSLTTWGTTPGCVYPGDQIQAWLKVTGTGVTVNHAWNTTGNNDLGGFPDGGAYFTGTWVSEGP